MAGWIGRRDLSPPHLLSIFECLSVLFLACFCGTAVGVQNVVLRVDFDGLGEKADGLIPIFCSEGLVALIFQCVDLYVWDDKKGFDIRVRINEGCTYVSHFDDMKW